MFNACNNPNKGNKREANMKVCDLIELLEDMDPNADVLAMVQPRYPFEHRVEGAVQRGELLDSADESMDLDANDVFIVVGDQLRYGTKRAWEV
jgi:hypothetical protein